MAWLGDSCIWGACESDKKTRCETRLGRPVAGRHSYEGENWLGREKRVFRALSFAFQGYLMGTAIRRESGRGAAVTPYLTVVTTFR